MSNTPTIEKIDSLLTFWGGHDDNLAAVMERQGPDHPNRFSNEYYRRQWQLEKAELLQLRDGAITVEQCKHACRFFNNTPAWHTYGT